MLVGIGNGVRVRERPGVPGPGGCGERSQYSIPYLKFINPPEHAGGRDLWDHGYSGRFEEEEAGVGEYAH